MRVSLNWLREYVDVPVPVDELAHDLIMLGLEIVAIERPGAELTNIYTGKILSIDPHPDADKLVVCMTDIGKPEPLQIVCGAKNMNVGDIVPTAVHGATLAGGFEIGRRKMRGVESQGMMCSARELGLGDDHTGLLILDPTTQVGQDAIPILGLDDVILDLEITPNRGDWASMIGVAREVAALLATCVRMPEIRIEESGPPAAQLSSVTIENDDLCPRYIGRVLTGVKIAPSPQWLCRRLIASGQRPINNVVDITNYVLMETGHPLHAFDYDLLKENRIVVRTPRPGETITAIDGQVRGLTPDMLIIADGQVPVAIAGIMGGQDSEVGETTTRVFLESAYFKPVSIRKTARALGMQTEASTRFQRGADPEMTLYAVNRAAMLMQQVTGARVAPGLLDEYPRRVFPKEITLRYRRADLLLGTATPPVTQRAILENLGFAILESSEHSCKVRTPSWRHDATQEADLIEEIARLYGYDKIAVSLPKTRQSGMVLSPYDAPVRALRRFLVGQGLTEFFNWTFSCPEDVRRCRLDDACLNMVTLQNPLSEKQATMRSSLIPGLIAAVSRNVRHGATNVMAFELGPVYVPDPNRLLPKEPIRLGIVLSGFAGEKHWSLPQQPLTFYDLKGYGEAVLDHFAAPCAFEEAEFSHLIAGQCARIVSEGGVLGSLGQVRDEILKDYDVQQPVYLLEIDLEPLLARPRAAPQFQPPPIYPPSRRDMAVLVDVTVPAGALRATVTEAGGKLLKSVGIFDVYVGKQVPEGKKSVALSLVFQSEERTLTDEDTQQAWDRILKKLQAAFGAELR
jgi:phenylalanyl-tRNA synthetase beta chain